MSKDTRPCAVEGCDGESRKRGWCASHYSQWRRCGEVRPFKYKWAPEGSNCVVCDTPVEPGSRRRKHCSSACQTADSRNQGNRRSAFTCKLCGKVVDLRRRGETGRLPRTDTVWCRDCGRSSPEALRFHRYGVTPDQYDAATAAGCPICKRVGIELHVDHDHNCCPARAFRTCGKCVRGLICGNCNRALGLVRDEVETLRRAIAYLNSQG